jgi:hypothetical protein
VSGAAAAAPAPTPAPALTPAPAPALTPKRVLAMLVLPASLLPVVLLGPGLLHAPRKLARQTFAGVVRLERKLAPGRPHHAPPAPPTLARANLGKLYGTWRAFPQPGREGLVPKGPVQ